MQNTTTKRAQLFHQYCDRVPPLDRIIKWNCPKDHPTFQSASTANLKNEFKYLDGLGCVFGDVPESVFPKEITSLILRMGRDMEVREENERLAKEKRWRIYWSRNEGRERERRMRVKGWFSVKVLEEMLPHYGPEDQVSYTIHAINPLDLFSQFALNVYERDLDATMAALVVVYPGWRVTSAPLVWSDSARVTRYLTEKFGPDWYWPQA